MPRPAAMDRNRKLGSVSLREMQELTIPQAATNYPGLIPRARKRAGFVGMSDLELGYPVCAGAGAECILR
jgi:hypothetical protein